VSKRKRVVFIHYRIGERDGVSLEIEKRARLFRRLGAGVFYIAGFFGLAQENAYCVKELDIKETFNRFIREDSFYQKLCDENLSVALYYQQEAKIYRKLQKAFEEIKPNLVFVHNLFSHAYNLPATTALAKLLDRYQTPAVVVSHDFWFERRQFLKPKHHYIREILRSIPPNSFYVVKHQIINSLAFKELYQRRKIKAQVISDYFDYHQPATGIDHYNADLKRSLGINETDLVLLHATRITARKAIENAIIFARTLEKRLRNRSPIKINNKIFNRDSKVALLLPNFVEVDALAYYKQLRHLGEKIGLKVIWAGEKFMPERQRFNGVKKYSLWDSYVIADFVSYTSTWEGYGNQFLEAVYFKKLPLIFEYPVFIKDIKKEGYQYVSLGNEVKKRNGFHLVPKERIQKAVEQTIEFLQNPPRVAKITNQNFNIAKKLHDQRILAEDLRKLFPSFQPFESNKEKI